MKEERSTPQYQNKVREGDTYENDILYLLMYKSTSCISRPPIFKVKNRISHHNFRRKQMKFTPTEISQNANFFPENVLKTP